MKKYTKYIKWLGIFALLFIPSAGFAADIISWDTLQSITFTPPDTDLSVGFLAQLFGFVPGIPQFAKAGETIFGPIFAVFNAGMLGLSGVFLSYTIFKVVTETTMDGSSMGKSATIWTTVRVALSATLLVPQTGGYSIINVIVMWVVIQSIGLADLTWNNALEFLKRGVPVTAMEQRAGVDYSLIDYGVTTGTSVIDDSNQVYNIGSADVLRSLVCAYTLQDALKQKAGRNVSEFSLYKVTEAQGQPAGKQFFSSYSGGIYQFPYVEGEATGKGKLNGKDVTGLLLPLAKYNDIRVRAKDVPSVTGICGTISYILPAKLTRAEFQSDELYTAASAVYLPAKKQGLQQMISALEPIAKELVNLAKLDKDNRRNLDPDAYIVKKGKKPIKFSAGGEGAIRYSSDKLQYLNFYTNKDQDDSVSDSGIEWPKGASEILAAAANYQLAVADARSGKAAETATKGIALTYKNAKDKGWLMAGSYYKLLLQASNLSIVDLTLYRPTAYTADGTEPLGVDEAKKRSDVPWASPFFSPTRSQNLIALLSGIDGSKSGVNKETLNRALAWVYFTTPYAKLRGKTIVTGTGFTQSIDRGEGSTGLQKVVRTVENVLRSNETLIRIKLYAGAISIATIYTAPIGLALIAGIPMDFLWFDVNKIMTRWKELMGPASPEKDPIVKLQKLGQTLIDRSMAYLDQMREFLMATSIAYMVGALLQTALSFVVGAGSFWGATTGISMAIQTGLQAASTSNEIARTIIYMYLPIGLAIIGPLFIAGVTLAIYVPLIPYLLFLFGTMSWFISIIVLMAASPIICFLMLWGSASQENPLLSREAEQFVMQMIAVFFRPTLMVIGLIVGVALARIGVDVLNSGFSIIVNDFLTSEGNENLQMVEDIGIVVIYTFTMVSLVNLCFSTIHLLYSEVMRVAQPHITIAGAGMEEKYLGEVKAGAMPMAEAGIGGAKEQVAGLKGLGGSMGKVEAIKKDKETTATGGGEKPKKPT